MKKDEIREDFPTTDDDVTGNEVEESRRRFLKQAGRLAVYTPPAMALMMQPSEASFLRSGAIVSIRERLEQSDYWEKEEIQSFLDRIASYFKSWFGSSGD